MGEKTRKNEGFFKSLSRLECKFIQFFRRRLAPNPWLVLEELKKSYDLLKDKYQGNPHFDKFEYYLRTAEETLCRLKVNYVYFWKLTHRAKEELIFLTDKDKFDLLAINIIMQFDTIVDDENLKTLYLGKDWNIEYINQIENKTMEKYIKAPGLLVSGLIKFVYEKDNLTPEEEEKIREYFRKALNIIYDYYVDRSLYKLAISYYYVNISTLISLFAIGTFILVHKGLFKGDTSLYGIILSGIIGALAGNISIYKDRLPREIFLMAIRGYVLRPFFYHVIGKAIVGVIAAALMYLAAKSGFIISLDTFSLSTQKYIIYLLSFSAGFSGTALLSKFVDNVISKITYQLEKTTTAKVREKFSTKKNKPEIPPLTKGIR